MVSKHNIMILFILFACAHALIDFSWDRLHSINNPKELENVVGEYIELFPCEECRYHFTELVQTHPIPIDTVYTREEVRIWSWLTHNLVNKRLGKEWYPLSTYLNGTSVT